MVAMSQWVHQSELAKFLDSQQVLARTRAPSTPSITGLPPQQPGAEDIQRLDQLVSALHNLRLRLSSFPDLVEHVDDVLEYVEQLQQDYPLHEPNRSFDRLLSLRATLFWLPTTLLVPDESDLGALTMMSHFYALALVLEPLFPECGGLYLGNMSLEPLEKVCQMMQARSAALPHDTTIQTALSILDVPMQVAHAYRATRRATTGIATSYKFSPQIASPQSGYGTHSFNLPSPPEMSRHPSYSSPIIQSPSMLQNTYPMNTFQNTIPNRVGSITGRVVEEPRMSIGSSMVPQNTNSDTSTTNIDYFVGTTGFATIPSYGSMDGYQNRLVQTSFSSPVWT